MGQHFLQTAQGVRYDMFHCEQIKTTSLNAEISGMVSYAAYKGLDMHKQLPFNMRLFKDACYRLHMVNKTIFANYSR